MAVARASLPAGRGGTDRPAGPAFAVVDHKGFPAQIEGNEDRLRTFAGKAALYAEAVEAATGRPCRELWLHQPVVGRASRIAIEPGGSETLAR